MTKIIFLVFITFTVLVQVYSSYREKDTPISVWKIFQFKVNVTQNSPYGKTESAHEEYTKMMPTYTKEDVEAWEFFKNLYSKTYKDEREERQRMQNFVTNKRFIEQNNKLYQEGKVSYKLRINQFADRGEEETAKGILIRNIVRTMTHGSQEKNIANEDGIEFTHGKFIPFHKGVPGNIRKITDLINGSLDWTQQSKVSFVTFSNERIYIIRRMEYPVMKSQETIHHEGKLFHWIWIAGPAGFYLISTLIMVILVISAIFCVSFIFNKPREPYNNLTRNRTKPNSISPEDVVFLIEPDTKEDHKPKNLV